jgi:signal transduction histidine kinase/CheY-like chemotaxis protein
MRRRVDATRIRMATRDMPRNAAAGLGGVVIGLIGMSHVGPGWTFRFDSYVLLWAAVTALTIIAKSSYAMWVERRAPDDESVIATVRVHAANFAVSGACWGSAAWLLLPARSVQQDAFLLAGMAMVMMGAAGAQAVCRPVVIGFTGALSVVFVTGLLRLGDLFHLGLGFGFAVYGVVVLMFARNQELAVTRAIELALENEELLAEKSAEQRATQSARAAAEQARERAEKADRTKTTFIAATSHDLRQPMHALVQYVEHLRRTCTDRLSLATIGRIEESVTAMENLLNGVLDFSKISMGAIKPDIRVFPVDRLLRGVETQIRPLAEAKGLALRIESSGGHCESDEVLLGRIVRNIAQNAVRYTAGGSIAIRAVLRGDTVRVLVADSGIGIASSEKQRVFDEYYQVDNRARDRRKGLGLGLAIVRDLARLLNLGIRLKSRPGVGSTFAVEIPRARSAEIADDALPARAARDLVRGAFVVLIDDDPLALDAFGTTLTDLGCRVLKAGSGVEAIHALAQAEFAPQIVVSDYRLAGDENGLAAIEMVVANQRALYGEAFPLPALVVSGDTSPEELERVARAGYPMLHKPVGARRLHQALDAALQPAAEAQRA